MSFGCFFFSSRRRHTRLQGDWSSDVCSSDLVPFRRALVPGYDDVTSAARQAGAYGATLSGSGPTVVAVVVSDGVGAVGAAMVRAWGACGIAAQTFHADRPAGGFETA